MDDYLPQQHRHTNHKSSFPSLQNYILYVIYIHIHILHNISTPITILILHCVTFKRNIMCFYLEKPNFLRSQKGMHTTLNVTI